MSDAPGSRLLKFAEHLPSAPQAADKRESWTVLIVDDEDEVHRVTKLALGRKEVFGRALDLRSAYSAEEARRLLLGGLSPAVILLDVVMETDDAGLKLASWIRSELKNRAVRIILRTGQPGQAPENSVILAYEINDYKEKTELTSSKLFNAIVTAIRGFSDIRVIESSKRGMEMILLAAPELFKLQSLKIFATGVLTQLIALMHTKSGGVFVDMSGFSASSSLDGYAVLAGTGRFEALVDAGRGESLPPRALEAIERAEASRRPYYEDGRFAAVLQDPEGERSVLYIEDCPSLDEIDLKLVSLYCLNVTAAFVNMRLFATLQGELSNESALLREIHHRVKNNLQILKSLVSLAESEESARPADILAATKLRIASMAAVHDHIYVSGQNETVDFGVCVDTVVREFEGGPPVEFEGDRITLSLEKAVPAALLANELMSLGPLARGGGEAPLRLSARATGGPSVLLTLEGGIDLGRCDERSLNRILVEALAKQLGGAATFACEPQVRIEVRFPL